MSFTKYQEDNIKIFEDRLFMRHTTETPDYSFQTEIHSSITVQKKTKAKQKKKTKTIKCCDCGKTFTFSGGEQHFYEKHNLSDPRRCEICRKTRRTKFIESEMKKGISI